MQYFSRKSQILVKISQKCEIFEKTKKVLELSEDQIDKKPLKNY